MGIIRYTGHPFIDVGVATIVTAAGVNKPAEVEAEHIEHFAQEVIELYMNPAMAGYLSYVVFANARFANPAQIKNPQYDAPRRAALAQLLGLWKPDALVPAKEESADEGEQCVFSGDSAVMRASRMFIPMTTDETNINFVPQGRPRLPISGWCLLAILCMPLGCLNSEGKMWLVHSTDPTTIQHFAALNLQRNRSAFQMQSLEKLPNYKFAKTYLIGDLLDAQGFKPKDVPLTAYLFTSSGQKSEVNIYHLPSRVLRFIVAARRFCPDAWVEVVNRGKALNKAEPEIGDGKIVYLERNYFYEDLFDLPANATTFLRRYLLRPPTRRKPVGKQKVDPRFGYSYALEREAISWQLTEIFLERIMNMDKERISSIRDMADRLAEYIQHHDRRLFKNLFAARNDYQMRLVLLKAASASQDKLLPYEQFISVFFIDEGETLRPDWYLARDLLMVRIIERLHESDWIEANKELVDETNEKIEESQD